jgi:hypothetical protein
MVRVGDVNAIFSFQKHRYCVLLFSVLLCFMFLLLLLLLIESSFSVP